MTNLSLSKPPKKLLTVSPGLYYKVAENGRKTINSPTSGLLITSYKSEMTGEAIYDVVLVQGELLLIPAKKDKEATFD